MFFYIISIILYLLCIQTLNSIKIPLFLLPYIPIIVLYFPFVPISLIPMFTFSITRTYTTFCFIEFTLSFVF